MPTKKSSPNPSMRKQFTRKRTIPRGVIWGSIGLLIVLSVVVYVVKQVAHNASQAPTPTPTLYVPPEISVDDAYYLFANKAAFFLDVRPGKDWAAYHIDQSTSIPFDQLPNRLNELPKKGVIVIVDDEGELSSQASDILKQANFRLVTIMTGGMQGWIQGGYPFDGTAPY